MKKYLFCSVLFLVFPAFATITPVQNAATWSCPPSLSGTTVSCTVTSAIPTTSGNLIAVWIFWQANYPYSATVTDSPTSPQPNTFYNALGPTVQSATAPPTSAQIFYAKSIVGTTSPNDDVVKVTFICPDGTNSPYVNLACVLPNNPIITLAGIVMVEYSGLDPNNPLDSVSAGYSSVMGSMLDTGNVAPANSNLEVFGAGFADQNVAISPGSGFSALQAAHSTAGAGLVEDNTSPITGNNVLQRATATLSSGTGDWLMQMAIFRDVSWTVQGGWSPVRPGNIRYADQFPGVDMGQKINNAVASLAPLGGVVYIPPGTYNFATVISPNLRVTIQGAGASFDNAGPHCSTTLVWTGAGGTGVASISISGTSVSGSILDGFCLYANNPAPLLPVDVLIDISNGADQIDVRNIVIDYNTRAGKVQANVAGIRWGYVTISNGYPPVNDVECHSVFVQDAAPVDFQVLDVRAEFKGYNCRGLSGTNLDSVVAWQLGQTGTPHVTPSLTVVKFDCYSCAADADNPNTTAVLVYNVNSATFFGLYCEQVASDGHCVQVPSTATQEVGFNLNLYGTRFAAVCPGTPCTDSISAVFIDFASAYVKIDGGVMIGSWASTNYLVNDIACGAITTMSNIIPAGGTVFAGAPSGCVLNSFADIIE
ncbi:MAG TPA: hypothetical protein VK763_04495 [Terriglobales bacterium]|nr:hypothetical protein [Terriglobales bacterium]